MGWTRGSMVIVASIGLLQAKAPDPATRGRDSAPSVGADGKAPDLGLPVPRGVEGPTSLAPLPMEPIPDDPPPHEGAMFRFPHRLEPPDLVLVEVLEALPGRPITGERLVRPDGTISLGFYGDVHVAGLTAEQAKVKVIRHLQTYLTDESLGLVLAELGDGLTPPPGGVAPPPTEDAVDGKTPAVAKDHGRPRSKGRASRQPAEPRRHARRDDEARDDAGPPKSPLVLVDVSPESSTRVFIDITSYNTDVYYVLGDFSSPGRLPFTGNETVLDAIQYGGGLIPRDGTWALHLYRPARGGKPGHDYAIDLAAIMKGDQKANLQVFPGDRLIFARSAEAKSETKAPKPK